MRYKHGEYILIFGIILMIISALLSVVLKLNVGAIVVISFILMACGISIKKSKK